VNRKKPEAISLICRAVDFSCRQTRLVVERSSTNYRRFLLSLYSVFSLVDIARDLAATDGKIAKDLVCSSVSSPTIQEMLIAVLAVDE